MPAPCGKTHGGTGILTGEQSSRKARNSEVYRMGGWARPGRMWSSTKGRRILTRRSWTVLCQVTANGIEGFVQMPEREITAFFNRLACSAKRKLLNNCGFNMQNRSGFG